MARRLKTYQTSLGFFDLAVAAPSMKAAAEAWGTKTEDFRRGFAKQTDDPAIVAATMGKPGVVLKRPVGSNAPFNEHVELPKDLPGKLKERPPSLHPRQKNRRLASSTKKPPARRHLRSTASRSGARKRVGRKRPRGRRSAKGASNQSQGPKKRLKKPSGTTKPRSPKSHAKVLHSTDGRERRMRAGIRSRRN
jgi:colicin import membrane protein